MVGLAVIGPGAALAGTLDQQQIDASGGYFVTDSAASIAQSFTAGLSGGLNRVDLSLSKTGAPTQPLSVEIRNISGGAPGSVVLAGQSVPVSSVTSTAAFVPIDFAPPAPVAAGTQYAIVAYSSTGAGVPYNWLYGYNTSSNLYPAGGAFTIAASPPAGAWSPVPSSADFAFKTYVVPTPGPTGERAAALKKCKKKHKKNHNKKKFKKCEKKANLLPV